MTHHIRALHLIHPAYPLLGAFLAPYQPLCRTLSPIICFLDINDKIGENGLRDQNCAEKWVHCRLRKIWLILIHREEVPFVRMITDVRICNLQFPVGLARRVVPEDRLGFIDCEHHEVCLSSKGNIGAQGFLLDEQGDHRVAYKTYFFHLLYERWARLDLVWGYSEYPTILWYECDPLSPRDLKEWEPGLYAYISAPVGFQAHLVICSPPEYFTSPEDYIIHIDTAFLLCLWCAPVETLDLRKAVDSRALLGLNDRPIGLRVNNQINTLLIRTEEERCRVVFVLNILELNIEFSVLLIYNAYSTLSYCRVPAN